MFRDQRERIHAVLSLADQVDLLKALEQISQLVARGLFVVDNDDVDGHFGFTLSIGKAANAGNSGSREYARAGKHLRPEGVSYKILRACVMMRTERAYFHAATQGYAASRTNPAQ